MIPIYDENPTLRAPWVNWLLLGALAGVWVYVQGAGLSRVALATSICEGGMVPGELTHLMRQHVRVPVMEGISCVPGGEIGLWSILTSMFLHGSWVHLLGNMLFLWIFGNNIEDSMGHVRFLLFYLVCGVAAALAQILINPSSAAPMVGASGAISGVLGAYLILYPRVWVRVYLPPFFFFPLPAWIVLLEWFVAQVLSGLPQLNPLHGRMMSSGVAVWAHIGGFVAGIVLVRVFEKASYVQERVRAERRFRRA